MSAFLTTVTFALLTHLTHQKEPTVKLSYFKLEEDIHFEGCEPQTPDANSKSSCAISCWSAGGYCALFSFRKSSSCVAGASCCFICPRGDVVTNLTFSSVSFMKPYQFDFREMRGGIDRPLSTVTSGCVFYMRCVMLDNNGLFLVFYKSGNMINFYFRARNDGYYGDKDVVLTDMWYGVYSSDTLFRTQNFLKNKTVEIHVLFQTAGAVFYINRKYLVTYPNYRLPPTIIRNIQVAGNIYIERMYL